MVFTARFVIIACSPKGCGNPVFFGNYVIYNLCSTRLLRRSVPRNGAISA